MQRAVSSWNFPFPLTLLSHRRFCRIIRLISLYNSLTILVCVESNGLSRVNSAKVSLILWVRIETITNSDWTLFRLWCIANGVWWSRRLWKRDDNICESAGGFQTASVSNSQKQTLFKSQLHILTPTKRVDSCEHFLRLRERNPKQYQVLLVTCKVQDCRMWHDSQEPHLCWYFEK